MPGAEEFRTVALALPEVVEKETWGHPTFRFRNKMFASMAEDGSTASVKATKEEQSALLAAAPDTFFVPAYVGHHGWVGINLPRADPGELHDLIVEAWRLTAPKRVVKAYDEAS